MKSVNEFSFNDEFISIGKNTRDFSRGMNFQNK